MRIIHKNKLSYYIANRNIDYLCKKGRRYFMEMTMEAKSLKMDVMEELMAIDSPETLKKIKSYIAKVRKQNTMNDATRKALEEMKNGEMVHFSSFDAYVKATENA